MSLSGNLGNAGDEARSLYEQLRGITSEIKGQATEVSKTRKAFREFEKGAQNLKLQYEGINSLSDDQVKKLNEQLNKQKAILDQEIKSYEINSEISSKIVEIQEEIKNGNLTKKEGNDYLLSEIQLLQNITDEEKAILSAMHDEENVLGKIVGETQKEAQLRDKVNNKLGVTGGILEGIKDLSPALAKGLKIDKIADGMKNFADQSLRAERNVSRLRVAGEGARIAFESLGETLTDPAIVGAAIVKGFLAVEEAQKDFRNQTGQTIDHFDTLNMSLLTSAEYIKSAVELSKQLSVNAAVVFSTETITEVGELTEHMGLGAKEAANLAKFAKLSGKELSTVTDNTFKATSEFIKTNKVGINVKDVFNDIGGVSDSISLSLGGHPGKIRDAALAARKLGISLEQVDKISSSLLQFESSISAELEAELLTGKQLNLEKAREFALMNNMEGVANELVKNQSIMQAFASDNRIEQESVAKAMGMSREEMSKMIFNQQIQSGLSTEQARKAANISEEEAKRLTVTKQISVAVDNITQAFGGVLSYLTPLLSNATALKVVFAAIGGIYLTKMIMSIAATTASIITQTAANVGLASSQTVVAATSGGMGAGLVGAGKALGSFGKSAISAIPILLAIGAAAVGIGYGLNLATPAIVAIGGVIGTVFGGIVDVIKGVTDGFVNMFNAVSMDNIGPLLLLGPALLGISAGLAAMGISGLLAMPTLLALTAVGSVSEGLGSIFGGDEEKTSSSKTNEMSGIEKKLDKLISVVEQGGVVMLDSNRVGEFLPKMLALNESKVGG